MTRPSKIFNICNLYIIIWLLYNFHWNDVGDVFPIMESLSNIFLAINLGISLLCTFIVIFKYPSNSFRRNTSILLFLFVVYGLLHLLFDNDIMIRNINKGSYLIGAMRTFLPIYTFFLFTKLGYLTEDLIKFWVWIFLIETIIIYLSFGGYLENDDIYELGTNNRGYLFVSLLPLIYFYRNKPWVQYVLLSILIAFTVYSMKRGAILTTLLCSIFFFWDKTKNVHTSKKILVLTIFMILVGIGSQLIEVLYSQSDFFQKRVSDTLEGNSSNRDLIVSSLLSKYANGNPLSWLFGFGANATIRDIGIEAHNDWVEVLYNQGLLGFCAFINFWIVWFLLWRKQESNNTELSLLVGLLFLSNFPRTLFSMWYSNANMFVTLPLGFCLAHIYLSPPQKEILN